MQTRTTLLTLLLGAAIVCNGRADTVILKSGEKLEGKIKSESDTEVVIDHKMSASVTDVRTIPKSEIEKIEKESPDVAAFEEIKNLKPDPKSSFSPDTYARIISLLKNFQTQYPNSTHNKEVQLDLDAFEQEKTRVDAGEVKFLGQWISKDEADKRKIQIQGQQLFGTMKEQAARGDLAGALSTFDQIEKSYATTRIFPDAVEFARQIVPRLQKDLARRAQNITYEQEQFKKQLAMTSEPQRSQLDAANKNEQAKYAAAVATSLKSGTKWPPLIPRSIASVDALQKAATAEAARLASLPVPKMRESNSRVDQAKGALGSKDLMSADRFLRDAQQAWPQSEEVKYYTAQLTELKAAAAASPSPSPSPSPTPRPTAVAAGADAQKTAGAGAATEQKPFFATIPGALTIVGAVVVIIIGGVIFSRMKAKGGGE